MTIGSSSLLLMHSIKSGIGSPISRNTMHAKRRTIPKASSIASGAQAFYASPARCQTRTSLPCGKQVTWLVPISRERNSGKLSPRHHIGRRKGGMNDSAVPSPLPLRDRRRPPAPIPLTGRLGPWRYYRALRTNPITTWRQEAYETPILVDRGPLGDIIVVNAPDAIRRVFLDNVGNYPKDRLQLEKLGPGLGRGLLTTDGEDWKFQRRTLAPAVSAAGGHRLRAHHGRSCS